MKQLLLSLLLISGTCTAALAQKPQVFQTDGKAIKGYDAVAFFTDNKPVAGNPEFAYEWNGASWLFASRQHLDSFKTAPAKYAPQYGGYCAFGCSQGHKAPTETNTWTIIDGKLYFNYNQKVKEMWSKKTDELIPKADKAWETVKNMD